MPEGKPETISECPCGSKSLLMGADFFGEWHSIECGSCNRTTGACDTREEAVRSWNARIAEETD